MADKKVKGAGGRFLPGSNIAKHREWRGLKARSLSGNFSAEF